MLGYKECNFSIVKEECEKKIFKLIDKFLIKFVIFLK